MKIELTYDDRHAMLLTRTAALAVRAVVNVFLEDGSAYVVKLDPGVYAVEIRSPGTPVNAPASRGYVQSMILPAQIDD
jgi:hypothetical protein